MDFLTLLGISFKTAPLAVREKIVLDAESALRLLERIRDEGVLREALILSTCNRSEVYAVHRGGGDTVDYVCGLVNKATGSTVLSDPGYRYVLHKREAVEHLFRVGSGLDSMVVGETQITGQVKEAYSMTCEAKTAGAFLHKLLHMTFRVAKKIRTETAVGTGSASVASAAVQRLRSLLGDLSGRAVLLIGAGRNGELAARYLLSSKVSRLLIANRSAQRARNLAWSLGGEGFGLDELEPLLQDVDAVVSTTSSPSFILTKASLQKAMENRKARPLIIADIATPRDVDPGASDIPGVTLFDLDLLKKVVEENRSNRERTAADAEAIIQDQVVSFFGWYRALRVQPIIVRLEERTESMRREEIRKLERHFSEDQLKKIDHFSRILLKRLLHNPLSQIKQCDRGTHLGMARLDAIRDLFGLTDDPERT